MRFLRKITALLTIDGWGKLSLLIAAIVMMALLDMVGVISILPFLTVVANPEAIETNAKLKWVYDQFGFANKDAFFIALGVCSFVILLVNSVLRAVISLSVLRFTWLKRYVICKRLLSQYLYGPYAFFLNRNSSELTAYLASEISRVVGGVLIPCMQVLTRSLLAIAILALLFAVDPVVSLVVVFVIGGGYAAIYLFARKKLSQTGEDLLEHSKRIFKVLNEAFGGIKDIKLKGKERIFIDKFAFSTQKNIDCFCSQHMIGQFPKYAFEVLAFGGILLITVYIVVVKKDYQQIIPLVGLYAFAAYRLMPALQQIFHELTMIRFNVPVLDTIYEDYINCKDESEEKFVKSDQVMPFTKEINFKNVTFQYPRAEKPVIENLNLAIKANTTVGFVGGTGAGKTTAVDILLGLLEPQQGGIIVDGTKIESDNRRMWQKNIGYVPQHIYLADDTVARNIAFGCEDHEIDLQAVERAGRLANIHDFIINELSEGYQTEVGERGVRLSGGQRQRIGIARALYNDPPLLVFDEATSALDGITEDAILEAIHNFIDKKTIIIIAHRLSTVKECKVIYMLEKGRIIDQGTYQELIKSNEQFRRMANAHKPDADSLQSLAEPSKMGMYGK